MTVPRPRSRVGDCRERRKLQFDVSQLAADPVAKVLTEDVSQDQHFVIEVDFKGSTDKWSVSCDGSGLHVSAPTLIEAIHALGNEYERRGLFDANKFDPLSTEKMKRTKKCRYCSGRIFFAETVNGKWMPIDFESVPVTLLGSVAGYVLSAVNGGTRAPQAQRITQRFRGPVWIAHQNVCGASPTAPDSPYLLERWETNRGVTVKATNEAMHDLARMALTLADEEKAA